MKKTKKILLVIVLIIVISLIIFAGTLLRKHLIIQDLVEKQLGYLGTDNYYVEVLNYEADDVPIKYYILDGKILEKHENGVESYYKYYENNKENSYLTSEYEKLACLDYEVSLPLYLEYEFFNEHFADIKDKKDYLWFLLNVDISSTKYDGKDCYLVDMTDCKKYIDYSSFNIGPFTLDSYGFKIYFEKDTGLIRENTYTLKKYNYKFNCVKKEDFIEPDISEYRVISDASEMYLKISDQLNYDFSTYTLLTVDFELKFDGFEDELEGSAIKELLTIIANNAVENKKYDIYLPDIIYLEENLDVKERMNNIIDINESDIEFLIDEETISQAIKPFEFKYDKDSSFKIVSNSENLNLDEFLNLRNEINESQKYQVKYIKTSDWDESETFDTIIINKI